MMSDKDKIKELQNIIKNLEEENKRLKKENDELKVRIRKYTNPDRHKRYYEKNKAKVKMKAKKYMNRIKKENPEKLKEWRRNAYLKRKQKKSNGNKN